MVAQVSVLLQVKIPLEMLLRLQKAVEDLDAVHRKEFKKAEDRLRVDPSQKSCDLVNVLRDRGRKVTIQNVARLAMRYGIDVLNDTANALAKIAEEGMTRGRPKHAV